MVWIEGESFRLDCPDFADVFEGGEVLEGFETPAVVVGVDEVVEVRLELPVAIVMVAFDGGFLDVRFIRSTWPLIRGADFGEAVLDAVLAAAHVEHMGDVAHSRSISISRRESELGAVAHWEAPDQGKPWPASRCLK